MWGSDINHDLEDSRRSANANLGEIEKIMCKVYLLDVSHVVVRARLYTLTLGPIYVGPCLVNLERVA